ncbi:hypothetical protein HX037_09775 [Ignatzschineria indica]|uniref:hypothetical protein n=1 Tax=Ignatzschineria indica TaxID=472583 RepID=UPI002576FFA6|nr:hypothetical protein [Ignatzschineria indica]MDM1546156.1 hypothetical protein [Ignatzschineria indica]
MNNIKTALYLRDWDYDSQDKRALKQHARTILVTEFDISMKGHIFCPVCTTPISRTPLEKDVTSNGRKATFKHLSRYQDIPCALRTKRAEGLSYKTEEEAREAIDNKDLTIISGFSKEAPSTDTLVDNMYDQTAIEDEDGPTTEVAISRHRGERFNLPSKITTVAGICRNFNENYYRYYFMPTFNQPLQLCNFLKDIRDVQGVDDIPKLYWGIIKGSASMGERDTSIRMTELQCHQWVKDFNLKNPDGCQKRHGINDHSQGRIVLFWGKIVKSGIGLAVEELTWGEYALLPEKYNSILLS